MIIKVKDTIEREIELTFPCSFKKNRYIYFHFENDKVSGGVAVFEDRVSPTEISTILTWNNLENLIPCKKSEVLEAYNLVLKHQREKYFPITVDLNSNTPTEVLENLNK